MRYIYGPVKSRRLGFSLGVSLTLHKTCNFDCLYCQLGRTSVKVCDRDEYIKAEDIIEEVRLWFENNPSQAAELNFATISGPGEPTLNTKIGELIREIKKITPAKLAVITNASLLSDAAVRSELFGADLIVPSLDTVVPSVFERVDRPHPGIKIEDIKNGLIAFRKEFKGEIWLEVMLVRGVNDDLRYIKKLKEAVELIRPDKIQLNSPVRTTAESGILPVDKYKLNKIKSILGDNCEII